MIHHSSFERINVFPDTTRVLNMIITVQTVFFGWELCNVEAECSSSVVTNRLLRDTCNFSIAHLLKEVVKFRSSLILTS